MLKQGILLLMFIASFGCESEKKQPVVNSGEATLVLLQTDRTFSKMSSERGMKSAFIEYLDSNAVLLRPDNRPIAGGDAIDFLIQQNDTEVIFTWDPQYAEIAQSGDLGYTYGIFRLKDKSGDSSIMGTYSRIWKKQNDGAWKLVLDTENRGVGESNQ